MTGQVFAPGKGLGISCMSLPFNLCRSPSFLAAPTPARSACRIKCCLYKRTSASKCVPGAEERPQLLRHAAAIACIGAPLPCYLPCSPVHRYMETSQSPFESNIDNPVKLSMLCRPSCSWLTLYGLTSNLAHSQHHPQVKPCFTLQGSGSLSWPMFEKMHLSSSCSQSCDVHPAVLEHNTAAAIMQTAPQVHSQHRLQTTRLGW